MSLKNIVRACAAGNGKTYSICKKAKELANQGNKIVIITYTNKGVDSIIHEYCKQNFGVIDSNVQVISWYSFILRELIKPYQIYITNKINYIDSISFDNMYGNVNYFKKNQIQKYLIGKNVKANETSSLVIYLNEISNNEVIQRLEKRYNYLFIDEIQDLIGNDLQILDLLINSKIICEFVGDNKQATFKTHNSKIKKNSGKNIWEFFNDYIVNNQIEFFYDNKSRRCNKYICSFANAIYPTNNNIDSIQTETTKHDGVFILEENSYYDYIKEYNPQTLIYDIKSKQNYVNTLNFGVCKGMTFKRVAIISNGPLLDFLKGKQLKSPEKYYVAVTRAVNSVCIFVKNFNGIVNFDAEEILINNKKHKCLKWKTQA